MFIKDYKKITSFSIGNINFFFFHVSNSNVYVYNEICEYYGSFIDTNSFFKMYKKEGEQLNLTRQSSTTSTIYQTL